MMITSDKWSNRIVQVAVAVVSLITAVMNARYGYSVGANEVEKWLLVGFGIAIDIVKFLGLRYATNAFMKRYWVKGVGAMFGWSLAVLYGFNAALGFAAMTRTHMVEEASHYQKKVEKADKAYDAKFAHLQNLRKELEEMKNNPRYKSTTACSVPESRMTNESVFFCRTYYQKMGEIETAKKEVDVAEAAGKAEIRAIEDKVVSDPDPLMTMYSKWLGIAKEKLTFGWAVVFAFIAETIASVGNWAFSPSRMKPVRREKLETIRRRRGRSLGSRNKPKLTVVN